MTPGEWLVSLLAIVLVDLLLAGDNAVVIAMAARRLPLEMRKRAVFWGTAAAIVIRVALAFIAVALLQIRGLGVVGGVLLLGVAVRLMISEEDAHADAEKNGGKSPPGLWSAIGSIVVADVVMGLDNVLAVAGAARGDYWLIGIGIALSIPIMIAGSFIILRFMERAPWLVYAGGSLLVSIAARMTLDDKLVADEIILNYTSQWAIVAFATIVVTVSCVLRQKRKARKKRAAKRHAAKARAAEQRTAS